MPTSSAQRSFGAATFGAGLGAGFGVGEGVGEERTGRVGTGPGTGPAPSRPLEAYDAASPTTATLARSTAPTRTRRMASDPTRTPMDAPFAVDCRCPAPGQDIRTARRRRRNCPKPEGTAVPRSIRKPLLVLPVVALALGAAALAPSAQGATTTSAVTFDVPRIVDPIHVYGEPNLEVNPKTGAVHATGPQGTGTQRSIWNVSVDNGDSYRIVQNLPENSDKAAVTGALPTKSALGPGGGDTEIKISRDGRAWFNDLAALASFTSVTTTDDGKTTSVANPLAIPKPVGDRQWMALYDPQPSDNPISPYKGKTPLNYMEYADQVNGDDVAISTDGVDYSKSAGIYANDGVHGANHGTILVDQHTGKFLGMTTDKQQNSLALVVGVPAADATLTYHYNTIALDLPGDPQTLFPVLTQDGARNLYAVWIEDKTFQTWYSWAPPGADNEWKNWSTPRQISSPPSNVGVFPWVAAGKAPGIINVAWYGTDKTLKQLGSTGP